MDFIVVLECPKCGHEVTDNEENIVVERPSLLATKICDALKRISYPRGCRNCGHRSPMHEEDAVRFVSRVYDMARPSINCQQ